MVKELTQHPPQYMTQHPHLPEPKRTGPAAVVFGVLSLVGAVGLLLSMFVLPTAIVGLASLLFVVIGIIGAIAAAGSSRGKVAIFCAVQGFGVALAIAGSYLYVRTITLLGILVLLAGAIGTIVAAARARSTSAASGPTGPQPLGYTADGQPFFPIVGYTSDGRPVTADQAPGFQNRSTGTNGMAIAALIMAFVATPLAIPFGHIARSQIRRTGEQGGGMALAGLIFGYLWVGFILLALAVFFVGPKVL